MKQMSEQIKYMHENSASNNLTKSRHFVIQNKTCSKCSFSQGYLFYTWVFRGVAYIEISGAKILYAFHITALFSPPPMSLPYI